MSIVSPQTVEIKNAVAVRETGKAINCHWNNDDVDHWIPYGQIQAGSEVHHVGDRGILIVSRWFAKTAKLTKARSDG